MSQELAVVAPAHDEDQGSLIQIIQLPIIKERLHHLKGFVDQQVADAMAMVCTDDTVIQVKQIRAELSALFNEAEIQRKAVKNAVMQPYLDFEAVYKECISEPFKKADEDLRRKIVTVESGMKEECENRLREYFDELVLSRHINFLKFEQIGIRVSMADAKAKTQPPKKLREQVDQFVDRVAQDVDTICTMENGTEILSVYKTTLNLTNAIAQVNELHRQFEQAKAEQERLRAAKAQEAEAVRKVEAFAPPVTEKSSAVQDDLLSCTFTITDTLERLKLLKQFLDANGYKYTS